MTMRETLRRECVPLVILAALSVGAVWRSTLGGRVMAPGDLLLLMEPWKHHSRRFPEFSRARNPILDGIQQFYPWRKYAGEALRAGRIPLWNPHELCGNPFIANNQSAVFYPETWLHALLGTDRALGWATALHFFTAGSLMYAFLRTLGLRRRSSLLGAVAFTFNGFFVGWLCFPSFRSVPAWLPGMLLGFELAAQRRGWAWLALCAACTGLQFLAGNLHISLLVLIVFGAYVVFRCGQSRDVRLALGGTAAVLVGCALAAGQLLPVVELAPLSSRAGGAPYAAMLQSATPAPLLLTGLMPDLFGNPVDLNHWGADLGPVHREYIETVFYVGLVPLLLAPAALVRRPRAQGAFWLVVALVGVALALGTPVYALFYHLLPGAKALSGLGRAIVLTSTALSVLGALGLEALLTPSGSEGSLNAGKYALYAALGLGAVGLLGGGWVWVRSGALEQALPGLGGYTGAQMGRFALTLLAAAVLVALLRGGPRSAAAGLVGLLALDLLLCVWKFTPAVPREYLHVQTQTVGTLRAEQRPSRLLSLGRDPVRRMSPNTPMIVGLQDIQGSDSLEIGAYRRLLEAALTDRLGFRQPDPALPLIDLLGVRYVHCGVPLDPVSGLSLVSSDEGYLYRNDEALPRAFVAARCTTVATQEEALRRVSDAGFAPYMAVLVAPDSAPAASGRRGGEPVGLEASCATPEQLTLRGLLDRGQLVVISDTFFPGWRAFGDGRELPILRVDYAFRAVPVEEPTRRLELVYAPASFATGAFVSLVALGVLCGTVTLAWARRRRGAR